MFKKLNFTSMNDNDKSNPLAVQQEAKIVDQKIT
jgi:hypothetical protein